MNSPTIALKVLFLPALALAVNTSAAGVEDRLSSPWC
jgi:hypothetical protein